ncbi:related to YIH1 [Ustilago sp. UG-2017a]|nr:related to YIH1 [Ustilago sp. UG-2017a]
MDDDAATSALSTLIARIEAYAADPTLFSIPGPSTRHPLWLEDESQRLDSATQLAEELMALQSIYTDEAIHLLSITSHSGDTSSSAEYQTGKEDVADPQSWLPGSKITLSISTDIETSGSEDAIPTRLAVTMPSFYPHSARPPQLQLLSKYIGGFSVDSKLFGEILRAFYHRKDDEVGGEVVYAEEAAASAAWVGGSMDKGVNWGPGEVVLFEGIEWVKEKVLDWWTERQAERAKNAPATSTTSPAPTESHSNLATFDTAPALSQPKPFTGILFQTESVIERKSEFIGYAASISSPDEVPSVLTRILSDKRVARATHPIINAWVYKGADGVVHRDCDDDEETAAGGRLAHLLSILELENVIVVVTRWYGGVHLGPDRFKLINKSAREALELGGFIGGKGGDEEGGRGKGMGKRNI